MGNIELQLDERVMERARRLAKARNSTVEAVLTDIIARGVEAGDADRWLGMFGDEPELMDQVVESALAARERDALRAARE